MTRTHQVIAVHGEPDLEHHAQPDKLAFALIPLRRDPSRHHLVDEAPITLTTFNGVLNNVARGKYTALQVREEIGELGEAFSARIMSVLQSPVPKKRLSRLCDEERSAASPVPSPPKWKALR
jgi:hypothetical protein